MTVQGFRDRLLPPLLLIALWLSGPPLASATAVRLTVGDALPTLEAQALSGQQAVLPRDARGHGFVLVVGFSKAAAKTSRPWMDGCRVAAAARSAAPELDCYDVRMVEDVPRVFRGAVEHGMKSGLPVELQRNALLVYSENAAWRERLEMTDKKGTSVIACDAKGRVRATASGPFTEAELARLLEAIEPVPSVGE